MMVLLSEEGGWFAREEWSLRTVLPGVARVPLYIGQLGIAAPGRGPASTRVCSACRLFPVTDDQANSHWKSTTQLHPRTGFDCKGVLFIWPSVSSLVFVKSSNEEISLGFLNQKNEDLVQNIAAGSAPTQGRPLPTTKVKGLTAG